MFLSKLISNSPSRVVNLIFALATIFLLSNCTPQVNAPVAVPETINLPPPPELSAEPIIPPVKSDVFFAQASLKKLGYKIGYFDGIWGPRSAKAMIAFENDHNLETAGGRLSELNLSTLVNLSGIKRDAYQKSSVPAKTTSSTTTLEIAQKLGELQTEQKNGPHLIIVDKTFKVLSKPNPYSSELTDLVAGTGVYIISRLEDNWYEIESINRLKGYIQDY